jgi:hypothetical protein
VNARRWLAGMSTAAGAGAAVAVACGGGGQLVEGYFDDAGAYHLQDGAVLVPGSGCVGYDAGAFAGIDPDGSWSATLPRPACTANAQCHTLPPGFPWWENDCVEENPPEAGTCAFGIDYPPLYCNVGGGGDDYCQALYQQFVQAPRAQALARCVPCGQVLSSGGGCDFQPPGLCITDCLRSGEFQLFVARPGVEPHCESPCQP